MELTLKTIEVNTKIITDKQQPKKITTKTKEVNYVQNI